MEKKLTRAHDNIIIMKTDTLSKRGAKGCECRDTSGTDHIKNKTLFQPEGIVRFWCQRA